MKNIKGKITGDQKRLIRRYLIWCYKAAKEELDKIDRYFTQALVDDFILAQLSRSKEFRLPQTNNKYRKFIEDFEQYAKTKSEKAAKQKFVNEKHGDVEPGYRYLKNRVHAIEKAICHFLGPKEFGKIQALYEEEMTGRILGAREHA